MSTVGEPAIPSRTACFSLTTSIRCTVAGRPSNASIIRCCTTAAFGQSGTAKIVTCMGSWIIDTGRTVEVPARWKVKPTSLTTMRIGVLAEKCGVTAKTIRYYEQCGLLAPAPRTPAGYRDYSGEAITRLLFIRDAQAAGLSLAEVRSILNLRDSGDAPCEHVTALIAQHLRHIDQRLEDLRKARRTLRNLAQRAAATDPYACDEHAICTILSPASDARAPDRPSRQLRDNGPVGRFGTPTA